MVRCGAFRLWRLGSNPRSHVQIFFFMFFHRDLRGRGRRSNVYREATLPLPPGRRRLGCSDRVSSLYVRRSVRNAAKLFETRLPAAPFLFFWLRHHPSAVTHTATPRAPLLATRFKPRCQMADPTTYLYALQGSRLAPPGGQKANEYHKTPMDNGVRLRESSRNP